MSLDIIFSRPLLIGEFTAPLVALPLAPPLPLPLLPLPLAGLNREVTREATEGDDGGLIREGDAGGATAVQVNCFKLDYIFFTSSFT